MAELLPPQMVVNSRMLYFGWIPEDPEAVAALVDSRLTPMETRQVFMNQYVVDDESQTSGFGAYSLTYIGSDLVGNEVPADATPNRWWSHYFNSNAGMREYASARGVPATPGRTTIEVSGDTAVVTTYSDDTPVIRSTAKVGPVAGVARGQLHYTTDIGGKLVLGRYPYIAQYVDGWSIESLEFLDPSHSVYALRPKQPLEIVWGFYSPSASFCYPGGEETIS